MLMRGEQMNFNGWTFTSLKQENIMNVTFMKNSLQPPTSFTMIDVPTVLKKSPLKERVLLWSWLYFCNISVCPPPLSSFFILITLPSCLLAWTFFFHDFIAPFMLWCQALLHTETSVWVLAWHKTKWGIMGEWKEEGWAPVYWSMGMHCELHAVGLSVVCFV